MDANLKPTTYVPDFNLTISNKQLVLVSSNVCDACDVEKKGQLVIYFFFKKRNIHNDIVDD